MRPEFRRHRCCCCRQQHLYLQIPPLPSTRLSNTGTCMWTIIAALYKAINGNNEWSNRSFFKLQIKCSDLSTTRTPHFAKSLRPSKNARKVMRVGPLARSFLVGSLIPLTKRYACRRTAEHDYEKYLIPYLTRNVLLQLRNGIKSLENYDPCHWQSLDVLDCSLFFKKRSAMKMNHDIGCAFPRHCMTFWMNFDGLRRFQCPNKHVLQRSYQIVIQLPTVRMMQQHQAWVVCTLSLRIQRKSPSCDCNVFQIGFVENCVCLPIQRGPSPTAISTYSSH